jgi:hypothetical protein
MTAIWLLASATGLPQSAPETAPAPFFDEDSGRHLTIPPGEGATGKKSLKRSRGC